MAHLQIELFDSINENTDKYLNYGEASHLLGVSDATLRNWVRADYIKPKVNGAKKALFSEKDILELRNRLTEGDVNRLKSRANKRNSKSTFIPKEYLHNREDYKKIEHIVTYLKSRKISIQTAMLLLSLNLLKKHNLATFEPADITDTAEIEFRNEHIKKVFLEFKAECEDLSADNYSEILTASLPAEGEILGTIYQSLLAEGNKAQGGSYYTPVSVVNSIVEEYSRNIFSETVILDPCCGTGQFLLSFSKYKKSPRNLWGFDIDKTAVHIARVNLLLAYSKQDFFPNIYNKNTLEMQEDAEFDIVATNPPWGYHFSNEALDKLTRWYPAITSKEAFSYFIVKGLKMLKNKGKLTLVLPESILKVKQHSDIRRHILDNTRVVKIKHLGNIFAKVLSPAIVLSLEKTDGKDSKVIIKNKSGKEHTVNQTRFLNNALYAFDTEIANEDDAIISKIYQTPHLTLEGKAHWALGIVTGNNKAILATTKNSSNEGILKGSDIKKYYFEAPSSFIKFEPKKFQQTAPEWKYRAAEKLIYKFISDTLTFAYDNQQTLTLNSANILIPKFDNYDIKLVLAFLNSVLFHYLYKKKFDTIKVLRGDLERLPFPIIDKDKTMKIVKLTDKMTGSDLSLTQRSNIQAELDEIIFSVFKLNKSEIEHIRMSIKK